ncbi:MAG TPA: DUF2892 domain-containing protein [Thermoanaerobaculia bacterium]
MAVSLRDTFGRGNVNVGKKERWAFALGGAALAALALRKRSKGSLGLAALGAPLLWRGATGHCPLYQRLGIDRTQPQVGDSFDQERVKPITEVEGTEGRPVTTTDRQPIGQNF